MRLNDAISGLVLLIFAIAVIGYSTTFPTLYGQEYGPSLFPILIGSGLAICAVALIVRGLAARRSAPADERAWLIWGDWARDPQHRMNMLMIPGLLICYILFSDFIGFFPLSVLLLSILLYRLGSSLLASVLYAVATTFVLQLLFARVLLVPLPPGLTGTLFQ